MSASLAITLGRQQDVGIHRDQTPVAQRTRVGLELLALRWAHVPPARCISHGSSLELARLPAADPPALTRTLRAGSAGVRAARGTRHRLPGSPSQSVLGAFPDRVQAR